MAHRIVLQISVNDPDIDDVIQRIAQKMGGRSAGWTKGRVVCEGVRMLERSHVSSPSTDPTVFDSENEII